MQRLISYGLLIAGFLLLYGCISASMTGASAVYDRYRLENKWTDHTIVLQIKQKIQNDSVFIGSDLDISSFNQRVLLTGQTTSKTARQKAARIAATTAQVKHVYNFIELLPPLSSERIMNDAWITTQIKSTIIAKAEMDPEQIKIVTEDGVVYLMGTLTHQQAKQAVYIAQYTPGVKRVVKIFRYIVLTNK
ncbi:MAG: BON domain-containing protein [Pseudomonadota bacterium]|nr:BON domain-containing protein [Gammaproteobacteria bacterium]MBU1558863.1 BON domain-containing protein [Gammaproteobacteria bacterium]MBU1927257.1 BON domain-containing protein [Gammaproteobacteria bacterium]MBU2545953.1 BON domain-containing protein [Gammaproteobacteria bacterium]